MVEGSPVWQRFERYRAAQRTLKAPDSDSAGLAPVVEAIYAAATEQPGRLRHLVGADAELIAATKAAMSAPAVSMGFEALMKISASLQFTPVPSALHSSLTL